jgi:CBS domain containing-hemolysin-like protein
MDGDSMLSLVFLAFLLAMAAYFALAETAVTSVSRIRLKLRSDRGERRAEQALSVLDRFDQAIATILIGTNIVHLSAATLTTVTVIRTWGAQWVALGTALCTVAVFFAGEMLPKSIAKRYSERCALGVAPSLCFFMRVFAPLARALSSVGEVISRLFKGEPEITVTEDELYDIIETMTDEGELDEERGELVHSALEFGDVTVERVFTPRVDMAALDVEEEPEKVLAFLRAELHSRIPVYEGSIDNIIGVLSIRRYIRSYLRTGEYPDLRSLLDEPCFVHQSASIDELREELNRRKLSLAIVTDNYGGTVGIVTIEDILEELVGEIWDEDDVVKEPIVDLGDGSLRVDAEETVSDVFEHLGFEDPEEDEELVNTQMGEWAYEQFTAIPRVGESFSYHGLSVTVDEMEHNRILKLKVELLPEKEEGGEDA